MTLRPAHYAGTFVAMVIIVVVIIVLVQANKGGGSAAPEAASTPVIGNRTKTASCLIQNTLPDRACTPGAVFASVTKDQICKLGYAKSVRNVPESEKNDVYAEYGIRTHRAGEYEVDHLISLELGGSNDIANLWPQAAEPKPGFHEKDRYENYLHDQVCNGQISLQEAQHRIADDWLKYWQEAGQP